MKRYDRENYDCLLHHTIFDKIIFKLKNIKIYYVFNSNSLYIKECKFENVFKKRKYFYYTSDINVKKLIERFTHISFIEKDIKIFNKNKYYIRTYIICG